MINKNKESVVNINGRMQVVPDVNIKFSEDETYYIYFPYSWRYTSAVLNENFKCIGWTSKFSSFYFPKRKYIKLFAKFISEDSIEEFNELNDDYDLHMVRAKISEKEFMDNQLEIICPKTNKFISQDDIDFAKQELDDFSFWLNLKQKGLIKYQ